MNGAESLVRTLISSEIGLCFANPGTSEMHFVAALDRVEGIRCVLTLFEGVATGAADGYFRIAGVPAATLLHLGPGLSNGLSNLHNARKAHSGIVNVVGDHATYHLELDAPLTADVVGIARTMSDWTRSSRSCLEVAPDGADAVAAARSGAGGIATLILPADTAWGEGCAPAPRVLQTPRSLVPPSQVLEAARALTSSGEKALLLLGGSALQGEALRLAGRIAAKTGCRLASENLNARMERGAGRVKVARLPYAVDSALSVLKPFRKVVLVGAKAPVAFFAYPHKPSVLTPTGCEICELASVHDDLEAALSSLSLEVDAEGMKSPGTAERASVELPSGPNSPSGIGIVLGALLPDDSIVIDESITTGRLFGSGTDEASPHDWLNSMGGSIGFGLPLAVGAAIAAPGRQVIALEGDGSAMYTPQALWSMAREGLRTTVLVFANRSYEILKAEFKAVGGGAPGPRAADMFALDRPRLSWSLMAKAHGVESGSAHDLSELARQLRRGFDSEGPYLVEVVM